MSGRFAVLVAVCALLSAEACKKKSEATSSGNSPPSASSGGEDIPRSSATTTTSTTPEAAAPQPEEPAAPQQVVSRDVLVREPVTEAAQVRHILVGWDETSGKNTDPRAAKRTRAEADRLALELLAKVRNGMDMPALMYDYSEDPGNARSGDPYAVRVDGDFVAPFEALSLRLNVGEAGICETMFGYHVIKRVQ